MENKKTIIKTTAYLTILLLAMGGSSPEYSGSWGAGGNTKIDSLKTVIQTASHDTTKVKALSDLAWKLMYSKPDTATILCEKALELLETDNLKVEGDSPSDHPFLRTAVFNTLGAINYIQSNYPQALEYYFKALKIRKELGDKKGMAASYNNIGLIYWNQSSYPQALEYYFKAVKIEVELGEKSTALAAFYNNIGIIYWYQSNYPQALEYYFKSLKIEEQLGDKKGMANSYCNIGIIYGSQSSYPQALRCFFKALKIFEQLGDKKDMANSYNNISSLYTSLFEQGDSPEYSGAGGWAAENPALLLDTALYYQQQALLINKELSDEYNMTFSLSGIGSIYFLKKDYPTVIQYYQQAALLADSIGALQQSSEAHSGLAACYEQLSSYKLSLEHYKQFATLKDSVFNEEKSKEIGKLEARHEMEMAEIKRKQEEEEQARIL
ncbi:MAG: tetratricopeptide repeat protein, partial [Cytophagales bacterium]|nr:tetratricopeptide repeat protein [Cytophagales bacterium]